MRNYVLFALIPLVLAVSLTGCGATHSSDIDQLNYPLIKSYDADFREEAAGEMESGQCPALSTLTVDYGQMRDEIRVLLGESVDINR